MMNSTLSWGNFDVSEWGKWVVCLILVVSGCGRVAAGEVTGGMGLVGSGENRFYLDQREVTVAQIQAFDPEYAPAYEYFKDSTMPATAISFDKAHAYCKAQGKRLPTSAEWTLACSTLEGLAFSYGNSYDPNEARVGRRVWTDGPKAVGSYEKNSHNIYDLTGNVWEWADNGESEGEKRYVHGGSWTDGPKHTRCTSRRRSDPTMRAVNYGFRCARSVGKEDLSRLARAEAEKLRKIKAASVREEAKRQRVRDKAEAARRAKLNARAEKALGEEAAARKVKAEKAARRAEAFARTVEGMVSVETSAYRKFYLDPRQVSVAEFKAFDPSYTPDELSAEADFPATGIGFEQAKAYCNSLGKQLPPAEEWVAACLGTKGMIFSYGTRYDPTLGRTGLEWYAGAGTAGGGAVNAYGLKDMVGNVWEWVDGWYDAEQELRPLYGGAWYDGADRAKCTGAVWATPDTKRSDVGFRCLVFKE
jgi:formylglycine-generating enzyme required for sulfatase activity